MFPTYIIQVGTVASELKAGKNLDLTMMNVSASHKYISILVVKFFLSMTGPKFEVLILQTQASQTNFSDIFVAYCLYQQIDPCR